MAALRGTVVHGDPGRDRHDLQPRRRRPRRHAGVLGNRDQRGRERPGAVDQDRSGHRGDRRRRCRSPRPASSPVKRRRWSRPSPRRPARHRRSGRSPSSRPEPRSPAVPRSRRAPSGASATVTCQTTFAGSTSTLSAVFTPSPGAQVTGSDSTAVGFVLGRAATTATMSLPARVTLGKRLTLDGEGRPTSRHHGRLTHRRGRVPGRQAGDQGLLADTGQRRRALPGDLQGARQALDLRRLPRRRQLLRLRHAACTRWRWSSPSRPGTSAR